MVLIIILEIEAMGRLCFFGNPWASSLIRGSQIVERLGSQNAAMEPEQLTSDDVLVSIKRCFGDDKLANTFSGAYVDVVDSFACIPWLRDRPQFGVIAISHIAKRFLDNELNGNKVVTIVEHHCNFERELRERRWPPKVVGYVGERGVFDLDVGVLKGYLRSIDMEFRMLCEFNSRQDVVKFYKDCDVQLTFRKDNDLYSEATGYLKNPLKLANAGSFGIPSVCYPEPSYIDEWNDCFMSARSYDEVIFWLDKIKNDEQFYNIVSNRALFRSEEYHIDNVAPRYLQLLGNKVIYKRERTMHQLVNLGPEERIIYPFEERIKRRGTENIDVEKSVNNLRDVSEVCMAHGLTCWLLFGTLLGAVRDQKLISHDRDTDLGVFDSDFDKLAAVLVDLKAMGFRLIRTEEGDSVVTIMRDDEYTDFYLFRDNGLKYTCQQPGLDAVVDKHHFDKLLELDIWGGKFLIPTGCRKLFRLWYGEDWETEKERVWAYSKS